MEGIVGCSWWWLNQQRHAAFWVDHSKLSDKFIPPKGFEESVNDSSWLHFYDSPYAYFHGFWENLPAELKWHCVREWRDSWKDIPMFQPPPDELDGEPLNFTCKRCNLRMIDELRFHSKLILSYQSHCFPWEWGKYRRTVHGKIVEYEGLGAWVMDSVCPQGCTEYSIGNLWIYNERNLVLTADEPLVVEVGDGRSY